MTVPKVLNVGLAVGRGTGSELADVFTKIANDLGSLLDVHVNICRSSHIYHSYHSLVTADHDFQYVHNETMQDAAHYEEFCREQAARGTKLIFRTAITAQPLYLVRQRLEAVKVEVFKSKSAEVLLIRDQAQGFYSGINEFTLDFSSVSRASTFCYEVFDRIVAYMLKRAHEHWGNDAEFEDLTLVYKFHLFDGVFDSWAQSLGRKYGLRIQFIQPDTMNRNILLNGFPKRELVIASNEYADIMENHFLNMFDQGSQENNFSQNVYLAPSLDYLTEYQTVHGSADDLTGQDRVNPSATMKAVAHILESNSENKGLEKAMDQTIQTLIGQRKCTRDQGGNLKTSAFASAVFHDLVKSYNKTNSPELMWNPSTVPSLAKEMRLIKTELPTLDLKSALLIIDFQKDFASRINNSSPSLNTLIANISHLVSRVRKAHNAPSSSSFPPFHCLKDVEILHIRFLSDNPNAQARRQMRIQNSGLNQPSVGVSGTPGADFIIPPLTNENERVFEKSVYDPFLVPEFESYIKKRGIRHLILTGLYGDVCVDATARSGFQRNLWISVVDGCVGNLHLDMRDWEMLARNAYGMRKVGLDMFETEMERKEQKTGLVRPKLA